MLHSDRVESAMMERPVSSPHLLGEFLEATRASLWALDPDRFTELRACVDGARRWGELGALEAFWSAHRMAEDAAVEVNWWQAEASLGVPLAPEPPFLLACACSGARLDATQQHAALPPGRVDLLFDRSRPACQRWAERDLDRRWHASFLSAREVLSRLPTRLDQACRAALTDWLYEGRRRRGLPPDPIEALELFELWARRYAGEYHGRVVDELTPLAERDAQLVVFVDE